MATTTKEPNAATRQRGLSVDQLLAISSIGGSEAPQWSPDGNQIMFASGIGGGTALWTVDADGGPLTRLTVGALGGGGLLSAYLPRWSPTGEYISYVSTKSGVDEVWLWAADGSGESQLTALGNRIEFVSWAPDGKSVVLASNKYGAFDIYRVEVPSGNTTRLTSNPLYEVYPSFTPDGRIIYVRLSEDWVDHDVILMEADGSNPRVVLQDTNFFDYHYGRTFGTPKVSPDGTTFLFRSHRSGWINIWAATVDGNGEPRQIAAAEADQSDAVWSPDGSRIAYIENHNGTTQLRVVAASGGEPEVLVAPEVGVCSGPAWSPDGSQLSYLFADVTKPNDLWVVNTDGANARQLTRSMLGGAVEDRLVRPEKVQYETFDGRMINAYLYRPADAETSGQKYPAIMWIHGGPTNQYMDSYQPQVQFFVSQGYVVLLPNVRGSSGYGREFEDLNDRDWGGGDLQDCVKGAEYLKTLSYVDGSHIGITGTSYGGIMTMNAVAFAPGVFQAAVSCSGYCDFLHMHSEQELRHVKLLEYEFGPLPEAEEIYRKCSALYKVAQATTPCFVLHGEGQYPNSITSKVFAMALEANYKPFWYKAYQGEHYYVRTSANIKRQLRDMLAFFNLYLKGLPHNLPESERPLTHLSGVITIPASGSARPAASAGVGQPPADMAN